MALLLKLKNNATGSLSAGITDSDTSLSLKAGEGAKFPAITGSQYFYATLQKSDGAWEVIKVTVVSGDSFTTIVRNIDSSTGSAMAFSENDIVSARPNVENVSDIVTELNAVSGGLGTMAAQNANAVAITGGSAAIDNETAGVKIKARDHGVANTPEVVNIIRGTGATPPVAANTVPVGTIYVRHEA